MPVKAPTYYQTLMVDPGVDADVLVTVYRRHIQRLLATPNGGSAAMYRLRAIEQAYAVLRDPVRRRRYDAELMMDADRATRQDDPDARAVTSAVEPPISAPISARASAATAVPTGVLDFGRYAGWSLRQVAMRDRDYLEWLRRTPGGRQYQAEIATILARR